MISLDKKYRTRNGKEVRLYAVDGAEEYIVHGAYEAGGKWYAVSWTKTGREYSELEGALDLIEVRETFTKTLVLNIYNTMISWYDTEDQAVHASEQSSILARVQVTISYQVGDGLVPGEENYRGNECS